MWRLIGVLCFSRLEAREVPCVPGDTVPWLAYAVQIVEGLIQQAVGDEIGHGPSLKEAMEQEVNEQVGPPSSRAAFNSNGQE